MCLKSEKIFNIFLDNIKEIDSENSPFFEEKNDEFFNKSCELEISFKT